MIDPVKEDVMTEFFTARRSNQDTAAAKRAAEDGPVYVADRGRPSHVLLSFDRTRAGPSRRQRARGAVRGLWTTPEDLRRSATC